MSRRPPDAGGASRRGFLTGAAGVIGAAGALSANTPAAAEQRRRSTAIEPFHGPNQAGIITAAQKHIYFAAFDLTAGKREEVMQLMRAWTDAAARMTSGDTAVALGEDAGQPAADSGEARGLSPECLTVTFGFGPGLFVKDGQDRYGLATRRPEALIDLPRFNGDQLVAQRTGGDLAIQACADDPQIVFHAVRQLARLADGVAQLRWAQSGFLAGYAGGQTPRNLMGFKDGTLNPVTRDTDLMDRFVWVGEEGGWMKGGSYMVARPIRIALEHWDHMKLAFQEQTMGRQKYSGAPIGKANEFDPLDLETVDKDGNPITPENSHAALAAPANNDGMQILRRSYSYDNGLSFTAERWPPWRQGYEYDAGLLFVCFQRDPRTGFIKMFDRMAKFDMMNQFTTHIGGGLFACPPGARPGGFVGQGLLGA